MHSPQSVYRRTCHPNFFSGAFPLGVARSLYDQSAIRYLLSQHLSYITICLAGPRVYVNNTGVRTHRLSSQIPDCFNPPPPPLNPLPPSAYPLDEFMAEYAFP